MRSASAAVITAMTLVLFAQTGLLACSSDAGEDDTPVAGAAGSSVAGSAGSGLAGAGGAGAGTGGAPTAGAAGSGLSGAGGASAGAGAGGAPTGGSGGAAGNAGAGGALGSAGSGGTAPFALSSPSIDKMDGCKKDAPAACDRFDSDFCLATIGGSNHSPELTWTAGPAGTQSYAISLFDESNGYAHWVIWNIPGNVNKLPASLAAGDSPSGITGAKQVSFYQAGTAYAGPGAKNHVYLFKLYALKTATFAANVPNSDKQIAVRMQLENSADVLAKVELRAASPQ